MDQFLTLSAADRAVAFQQAEARLRLPAASIEKDFWVCFTQGVKVRARAAIHERLLPTLEQHLATVIPPVLDWQLAVDQDDPDQQTLLFHYPGVTQTLDSSRSPYVRPVVRIEFGARSDTEPLEYCEIEPEIAKVFPEVVGSGRFAVRVVSPKRTFIEKAMLLHEQACRKTPKPPRVRLSRHYYDVNRLIGAGIADAALATEGLFANVVRHRAIYFPESLRDGHGYDSLTPAGLILRPDPAFLSDWRADYQKMRESMFYGSSPDFDEVLREVGRFEDGLRGR